MNKTLLLIICDFLLLNLIHFTAWDTLDEQVEQAAATAGVKGAQRAVEKGQAVSKNTVSSIVRRRSRLKGGARLMLMSKLSKRRSEEPVATAAGLRMKILPEGNRVLPNQPPPGY